MGRYAQPHVRAVLERLDGVQETASGWKFRCKAHGDGFDADRSGSVSIGRDGQVLVHCFVCGKDRAQDVLAAYGLQFADLYPPKAASLNGHHKPGANGTAPKPKRERGELVASFEYRDTAGHLVAIHGRFETQDGKKTFLWRLPEGDWDGGLGGLKMRDIPLYGAEWLGNAEQSVPVWFVEGEKACEACISAGLVATTFGGGAGTTDFGASLDLLRGRDVRLWPDHDDEGRKYMARVAKLLQPVCPSVLVLDPAEAIGSVRLPVKGDAVEYFAAGGTIDALEAALPRDGVAVTWLAHDALRVSTASVLGTIAISLRNIDYGGRTMDAEAEIRVGDATYTERLNLLSSSQREQLRRALESEYGKEAGWTGLLNRLLERARSAYLDVPRVHLFRGSLPEKQHRYLVDPLVPAGKTSVWFGDGSSGKTYLALYAALMAASGQPVLGLQTQPARPLLVDYETNVDEFEFRVGRLLAALRGQANRPAPAHPPLGYFAARGIPLADQIDVLRREVERGGFNWLIIDSAAAGCGGEPEKAEAALRYFGALARIGEGVTTLTIAHITKSGEHNTDRPFGSVVWHNQPRMTWHVSRVDEEDSDTIDVAFTCKKVNSGRKPRPVALRVSFDGEEGPVSLRRLDITDIPELNEKRPLPSRITDLLRNGPMTVGELAEVTGESADSISKTLRRGKGRQFTQIHGGAGGRGNSGAWALLTRTTAP